MGEIIQGDCLEVMAGMEAESVDLIVTSPPYANARKETYGGVEPDKYVEWFLPRAEQMRRVLKPTGSFVLNIREHCENGERHPYVLELILALRQQGWLWVEEYIWHKSNAMPSDIRKRFRNAWERILHFTVTPDFRIRHRRVALRAKEVVEKTPEGEIKKFMSSGSGMNIRMNNFAGRQHAYPTNVLYGPTATQTFGHSAVFPLWIPTFFIKVFSDPGNVVMDPFCGSGTTLEAAAKLDRRWIGIDPWDKAIEASMKRLGAT